MYLLNKSWFSCFLVIETEKTSLGRFIWIEDKQPLHLTNCFQMLVSNKEQLIKIDLFIEDKKKIEQDQRSLWPRRSVCNYYKDSQIILIRPCGWKFRRDSLVGICFDIQSSYLLEKMQARTTLLY